MIGFKIKSRDTLGMNKKNAGIPKQSNTLMALAAAGALLMLAAPAAAVTVTSGALSTVANGGIAPGDANNAYFFGPTPNVAAAQNLTSFTLSGVPNVFANPSNNPFSYATIQAPGGSTPFIVGVSFVPFAGTANLATFTLTSGSNLSFTMYVEYGNTDANALNDRYIAVTADGTTTATTNITDTAHTNAFASFNITGANAGDTFTVSSSSTSRAYIGGVTFQMSTPVPEPASILMIGSAMAALGLARRRRRA